MFRKNRERMERIERALEEQGRALATLAATLSESRKPDALATITDAFAKTAGNQSDLVKEIGDIALRAAASRMGIRGGRRRAETAQRRADGKYLPKPKPQPRVNTCQLCQNPYYPHPTIEMITAHRAHEAAMEQRAFEGARSVEEEEQGDDYLSDRDSKSPGTSHLPNGSTTH